MPLRPRTQLGLYELLSPLGAGGMGEVYRTRVLVSPDYDPLRSDPPYAAFLRKVGLLKQAASSPAETQP